MALWDNNGFGGYNPNPEPTPYTPPVEEQPVEETTPVEEPTEPVESIATESTVNETVNEEAPVETESTEETAVEKKRVGKRGAGRGRKGKEGFPHLDATVVEKVKEMLDVLSDEHVANAVKVLVHAKTAEPAKLVDELTDEKNRQKVADFAKTVDEFAYVDTSDMTAQLVMAFMTDKEFAPVLFEVLNAMAPDREFGVAGKDVMANAKAISSKWGDGVDLSMIDKLKV